MKANPVPTPEVRDKPTRGDALDLLPKDQAAVYCSVTGRVIYLSVDRYDIMHAARGLAQDLSKPTELSMMRLKRLVKYLMGTVTLALLYPYQSLREASRYSAYGDSDWAGDKVTRKSISSGILFRGRHPIEFWCTGQQLVSLSSGESEFYAAGTAAAYLLFMTYLVKEMKMIWKSIFTAAEIDHCNFCHSLKTLSAHLALGRPHLELEKNPKWQRLAS